MNDYPLYNTFKTKKTIQKIYTAKFIITKDSIDSESELL